MSIFKLPDLGEGLPDAEIHEWHVNEGDIVKVDQLLVSMETAKAVVDVPSPYAGKIIKLHGKPGDVIQVGAPLVEYLTETSTTPSTPTTSSIPTAASMPTTSSIPVAPECRPIGATVAGNIEVGDTIIHESAEGIQPTTQAGGIKILPALRLLADKLQLSLSSIPATGKDGQITIDDFAKALQKNLSQPAKKSMPITVPESNYQPLKGVRKAMAHSMKAAHDNIVSVTIVDDANISALPKGTDITCRLIRAIVHACQVEPILNAWFDGEKLAIDVRKEINIGLAVDSAEGLFVPVIKNAHLREDVDIRQDINRFKDQVQDRTLPQDDLKGATISLSNFGTFAGRYATPIVVPPMVAIIGSGRLREQLVLVDGQVVTARIMPLSVTFDHRAVTGGEASRFLKMMIDYLQQSLLV